MGKNKRRPARRFQLRTQIPVQEQYLALLRAGSTGFQDDDTIEIK